MWTIHNDLTYNALTQHAPPRAAFLAMSGLVLILPPHGVTGWFAAIVTLVFVAAVLGTLYDYRSQKQYRLRNLGNRARRLTDDTGGQLPGSNSGI